MNLNTSKYIIKQISLSQMTQMLDLIILISQPELTFVNIQSINLVSLNAPSYMV